MVTRQRPRNTRLLVVILVSLSLAIITVDYREGESGPLATLGDAAKAAMAPLQSAVTRVTRPIGNFFSGLAHLPTLADENRELKDMLQDLRAQIAANGNYRDLYYQVLALSQLQSLHPHSVPAVVIANGISNFDWSVTIDRGANDGIAVGMPVIAGTAQAPRLVGRVVDVTPDASDVLLIIDRRSAVAAVLSGSHQAGLVVGQGEADLRMELISPGTEVQGNEPVFTLGYEVNGQSGAFPPGILIGEVSRTISSGANELQEFVTVRPAVDFSTLQFVLVLKSRGSER